MPFLTFQCLSEHRRSRRQRPESAKVSGTTDETKVSGTAAETEVSGTNHAGWD